jgi:hypothetical protein
VEHRRTIACIPGAGWLVLDDLTGRGTHQLESFVHFGTAIQPRLAADRICLLPPGWTLLPFNLCTPPELITDIYSPAPGLRLPTQTLVLRATFPCRFGYFLGPLPASRIVCDNSHLRIESPGQPAISIRL